MSASIARTLPGWARAALMFGVPGVVLAGGGFAAWSSKHNATPVAATKPADWGSGAVLPAPSPTPILAPTPPPQVVQIVPPIAPVVVPAHIMHVYADKEALAEVQSATAERQAARMATASGSGRRLGEGTGGDAPGTSPATSEYAQRMQATEFGTLTPRPPNFPPEYTIKKNTRIPCIPDQPLSSEMVGPIMCITTQAVWSMDGNNVLLPVGTQINGTIEHGLSGGSQRLFPVWTDMLTPKPHQFPIPLGAPSADEMGQPGLPGDIRDHFWLKARDLAFVSIIQMGGSAITAAATSGNNNNTLNLGTPVSGSQSLAERAFSNEVGIPDTLYRGPGQPIVIITNKYINLEHYVQNRVIR